MGSRSNKSSMLILAVPVVLTLVMTLIPELCFADFADSLSGVKITLTRVILPTLSVIGIGLASMSFFTGNPNAKTHIFYAILGCIFSLSAQGLVDLIRDAVH